MKYCLVSNETVWAKAMLRKYMFEKLTDIEKDATSYPAPWWHNKCTMSSNLQSVMRACMGF